MTFTATVKAGFWRNHHDHEDVVYSEHLPADGDGTRPLLYLTIIFSIALLSLLLRNMVQTTTTTISVGGSGGRGGGGEVHVAILIVMVACVTELHVAILIVMVACVTNGLSALCKLLHMRIFSRNGIGSYSLDALSSHFETLSDSMVSLILLSIGAGWTLPSDVVRLGLGSSGSGGGGGLDGTTTLLVCYLTWSRIAAVAVALWT